MVPSARGGGEVYAGRGGVRAASCRNRWRGCSSSSRPAAKRWQQSGRSFLTCVFGARRTRKRWRAT
eukprot:669701-Pleurochrysis_carterae.AAC.1